METKINKEKVGGHLGYVGTELYFYPDDNFYLKTITGKTFVVGRIEIPENVILSEVEKVEASNVPDTLVYMKEYAAGTNRRLGKITMKWFFPIDELMKRPMQVLQSEPSK